MVAPPDVIALAAVPSLVGVVVPGRPERYTLVGRTLEVKERIGVLATPAQGDTCAHQQSSTFIPDPGH